LIGGTQLGNIIDYIETDYGSIPVLDNQEKINEAEQSAKVETTQIEQPQIHTNIISQ